MGGGFPLCPWLPWHGRGEIPSEIGSVSLSLSVFTFSSSALSPFRIYMEIRNSDWTETFAVIFYQKLAFLRPKKGINRLTGGPRGSGARPGGQARPLPRGHLGHHLALILFPIFSKYSKNILRPFLSRLDSVWYGVSAKHKTCNRQDQYVSPKNSIKSCQKYMKVEKVWDYLSTKQLLGLSSGV